MLSLLNSLENRKAFLSRMAETIDQVFTKTANIWGVDNNKKGTNTNRIVLFRKQPFNHKELKDRGSVIVRGWFGQESEIIKS